MDATEARGGVSAPPRGIGPWMRRVLEECDRAEGGFDSEAVHDLRVALRRCRSMADSIERVDPERGWRELRKAGRRLFRCLGDLRDAQVTIDWVSRLGSPEDPVRIALFARLQPQEDVLKRSAREALDGLDRKAWRKLSRRLAGRPSRLPSAGAVFESLALERLLEGLDLHRRALRSRSSVAWHRCRIGIKRFRYVVENFLPRRHAAWGADLKRLQDLLGEVHDLDVLKSEVLAVRAVVPTEDRARWNGTIAGERASRIAEYRGRTRARGSLWQTWRAELPDGQRLLDSGLARLAAWASCLDPEPARARQVARLALELFDRLSALEIDAVLADPAARRALEAAGLAQDVGRARKSKGHHKATYAALLVLEAPLGWTGEDMRRVALVARYHRGAEPAPHDEELAGIPEEERHLIFLLASLLRVANALNPGREQEVTRLRVDRQGEIVQIRAAGYRESAESAARVAAAKHLLESVTGNTFVVRPWAERPRLHLVSGGAGPIS